MSAPLDELVESILKQFFELLRGLPEAINQKDIGAIKSIRQRIELLEAQCTDIVPQMIPAQTASPLGSADDINSLGEANAAVGELMKDDTENLRVKSKKRKAELQQGLKEEEYAQIKKVLKGTQVLELLNSWQGVVSQSPATTSQEKQKENQDDNTNEEKEDAFGMLPNELLSEILVHHLQPTWQLVCKHVCHRWRLLLSVAGSASASLSESYASFLARGGHLEVLRWARSRGCPWDEETCAQAAREGHLEVLQWLISQGCPWDERTCASCAAEEGHLEVLQWLRSQGCPERGGL